MPPFYTESLFDVIRINMYEVAQDMAVNSDFSVMEVQLMLGDDMGTRVVNVCQRLLQLDLKREEIAVMGAMLLFSSCKYILEFFLSA